MSGMARHGRAELRLTSDHNLTGMGTRRCGKFYVETWINHAFVHNIRHHGQCKTACPQESLYQTERG